MNDAQKEFVARLIRDKVLVSTPLQLFSFMKLTKTQQNSMITGWIAEKKAEAQAVLANSANVKAASEAEANTSIAFYDSIVDPL